MESEKLLQQHNIRPTAVRLLILKGIKEFAAPFSLEELFLFLCTIDRSTVFRTLVLFEEHGLLHSFDDGSGKKKYCPHHLPAVNQGAASPVAPHHAHATCRVCGRVFCVEAPLPRFPLPDGFEPDSINVVITGVCPLCNKR